MFKKYNKKINHNVYYRLDKLDKKASDANVFIIAGEKGNGKSYAVKERALEYWRDTGKKFVYLRRFDDDVTATKTQLVFSDLKNLNELTGGYDFIAAEAGILKACTVLESKDKITKRNGVTCGYYGSIQNIVKRYSSIPFPEVDFIFFDEICPKVGGYLPEEVILFDICLSTILRRNDSAKIYLVGNTFDRNCPYFRKYNVDIDNTKQGDIGISYLSNSRGEGIKVAFEYCEDLEDNQNKLITSDRDNIVSGKWYQKQFDTRINEIEKFKSQYKFYVEGDNRIYLCDYKTKGLECGVFVSEYDELLPPENARVISHVYSTDPLYTNCFVGLTTEETAIFRLFKIGKVFYKDNLTGTEFERVYQTFN